MIDNNSFFPDEEETPKEEVKERKSKYSTPHGPRYTVALRSDVDPCCYKDFFETEKLAEAKEKANEGLIKYNRCCIVLDRTECPMEVYRVEPPPQVESEIKEEVKTVKRNRTVKRGR